LLGIEQFDEIDMTAPVLAGIVRNLAEGFSAAGVWTALGTFAISDMFDRAGVPSHARAGFAAETSLICAGPVLDSARFGWPDEEQIGDVGTDLLNQLQASLGVRFHKTSTALWSGHAGVGDAILLAAHLLGQGQCPRVLVMGADTLADMDSVKWLESDGRLKTEEMPIGLCPGEAAGCALLETVRSAQIRGSSARAAIAGCAARAPEVLIESESFVAARIAAASVIGKSIAATVSQALQQARVPLPFTGDLFVDLNGEEWRAAAWGYAQVALRDSVDFDRSNVIVPAASFAEIGAASGFAALCAAGEAMARRYARGPHALICSLADSGRVSAFVLAARA
jgi:3-oxoacyl-[acyl-carrier-protein] synthase-1